MSKIENIKSYEGQVLDNIFFRPMLTGGSAEELGIKVMYNMPVPTTLHFWKRTGDILKKYTSSGWSGGEPSQKFQKVLNLHKVKAEMAYSAEDYFSTVYELITGRADVNLDDLSGTELEEAETALFRSSIRESIRSTMWYGDTEREGELSTFDGFVKQIITDGNSGDLPICGFIPGYGGEDWAERLLKKLWEQSTEELRSLRSEGQLAFFVSTDVYNAYEEALDNVALESAYLAKQNGREALYYRGIPVIDVQLGGYADSVADLPHSFAILTDRRNLALAVNTGDFPGTEVRMWYNPDLMENRQRAIFMAGCDYLLPELVSCAVGLPVRNLKVDYSDGEVTVMGEINPSEEWMHSCTLMGYDAAGDISIDDESIMGDNGVIIGRSQSTTLSKATIIGYGNHGGYYCVDVL